MKKNLKYKLILISGFVLLFLVELFSPKEIDWRMSFSKKDKIPYGNYILFDLLPEIFSQKTINTTDLPAYNTLKDNQLSNGNYLIINNKFAADDLDTKELLEFAGNGGYVFIAAQQFKGLFADTLNIKTEMHFILGDSLGVNFTNLSLHQKEDYYFKSEAPPFYFSSFDTAHTTILGIDEKKRVNFIKTNFGEGAFYLNCVPFAFTNYNILKDNDDGYISKALSYLPAQNVFWDEYYKAGRISAQTPLRYILNRAQLRWAYYLGIISLIMFILFEGKRKQRIIPVITPLKNTTLEFVETIGRLYYQNKDHKNLAMKKITYFLEYIRSHLYMETQQYSNEFYKKLNAKTGICHAELEKLFGLINQIKSKEKIKESEINLLNRGIEKFYQMSKG